MMKVKAVAVIGPHRLRVWFSDGSVADWDHSDILQRSGPMVVPLHDPNYFARAFVEDGAVTWPNGYDACPEWLHESLVDGGELKPADAAA